MVFNKKIENHLLFLVHFIVCYAVQLRPRTEDRT